MSIKSILLIKSTKMNEVKLSPINEKFNKSNAKEIT